MNILTKAFPEQEHEILSNLNTLDDFQLSQKWDNEPCRYRYLLAIYFRHHELLNVIEKNPELQHAIHNNYQDLWFFIFDQVLLVLPAQQHNLSNALEILTKEFLSQMTIDSESSDVNNLTEEQIRSVPLEYFVSQALEKLYPLERLIILGKDKFSWSDEKICNYLEQHQKCSVTRSEINTYYMQGHSHLINVLPSDIVTIYLN